VTASITSGSLAVISSAVDSFVDLVSQLIVFVADRQIRKRDRNKYPAGKAR
jgi:divalent metal cation (Fe/Co/Zn/Cd) transporter